MCAAGTACSTVAAPHPPPTPQPPPPQQAHHHQAPWHAPAQPMPALPWAAHFSPTSIHVQTHCRQRLQCRRGRSRRTTPGRRRHGTQAPPSRIRGRIHHSGSRRGMRSYTQTAPARWWREGRPGKPCDRVGWGTAATSCVGAGLGALQGGSTGAWQADGCRSRATVAAPHLRRMWARLNLIACSAPSWGHAGCIQMCISICSEATWLCRLCSPRVPPPIPAGSQPGSRH